VIYNVVLLRYGVCDLCLCLYVGDIGGAMHYYIRGFCYGCFLLLRHTMLSFSLKLIVNVSSSVSEVLMGTIPYLSNFR